MKFEITGTVVLNWAVEVHDVESEKAAIEHAKDLVFDGFGHDDYDTSDESEGFAVARQAIEDAESVK